MYRHRIKGPKKDVERIARHLDARRHDIEHHYDAAMARYRGIPPLKLDRVTSRVMSVELEIRECYVLPAITAAVDSVLEQDMNVQHPDWSQER